MIKYVFFVIVFLNNTILYSQTPIINVNIYDIQITESSIFFRYIIKNEYEIPIWFHKFSGTSWLTRVDNTIHFAPVNNHATQWKTTRPRIVETIQVIPQGEITGYFHERHLGSLDRQTGNVIFRSLLPADYIDLTLVFTSVDIENPISDTQYRTLLEENMILVNRLIKMQE